MLSVLVFFVLMLGGGDAMAMTCASSVPLDDEVPNAEALKRMSMVDRNGWIKKVASKLMAVTYEREALSLQLKRLFIAGNYLHATDNFVDVKFGKKKRYMEIRRLLTQNFALSLRSEPYIDTNTGRLQNWSDYDVFFDYDKLLLRVKSDEEKTLLDRQYKEVKDRIDSLRNNVIVDWKLPGMEEYFKAQDEKKVGKKAAKTHEARVAGELYIVFLHRGVTNDTFSYRIKQCIRKRVPI